MAGVQSNRLPGDSVSDELVDVSVFTYWTVFEFRVFLRQREQFVSVGQRSARAGGQFEWRFAGTRRYAGTLEAFAKALPGAIEPAGFRPQPPNSLEKKCERHQHKPGQRDQ